MAARVGTWIIAGLLSAVLGPSLAACRGLETLKQRCVTGDVAACESACAKAVAGEGGCFHAGQLHRQRAGPEAISAELRQASSFFVKSCTGGYGDGCLFAAQMIEAPYAGGDEPTGNDLPKMIGDGELAEREAKLSLACERGSSAGCKRLGDVLIGKNSDPARAAYEKACTAGAEPDLCKAARTKEVDVAERWRLACTHSVADDCARLGDLLYAVDPPRALRLFASECDLRGVAQLEGGAGRFVGERVRQAKRGIPAADEAVPPAPAGAVPAQFVATAVNGQVALVEIDQTLRRHATELTGCTAKLPPSFSGKIEARLVVDLTGDVFRATLTDPSVPSEAGTCLVGALESLAFAPPASGLTTVDIAFVVAAPSVAPPK